MSSRFNFRTFVDQVGAPLELCCLIFTFLLHFFSLHPRYAYPSRNCYTVNTLQSCLSATCHVLRCYPGTSPSMYNSKWPVSFSREFFSQHNDHDDRGHPLDLSLRPTRETANCLSGPDGNARESFSPGLYKFMKIPDCGWQREELTHCLCLKCQLGTHILTLL